jgi:phenylalanyl-tRNA synthetase beta chain
MKFTYNWLKDFVDIKIKPEALADKLTMAGLEVKGIEARAGDFVFEAEITSNRPDWLSVIGVAREVAALTGEKLKNGSKSQRVRVSKKGAERLAIKVEDKNDCPLYTAKIIRNVLVGPSPKWLKERLESIGCRSINNVVDITNYVLFTLGEPLHAFDLDKLNAETIAVRRARPGEHINTIDGTVRKLDPDILIIADARQPVAVAGVMGGKDTEVTETTKNILLEAAVFNGAVVRRGRQKLGLQTDSSYRFERGVDFDTAESSAWLAARMIEDIAQGKCVLAKSSTTIRPKAKSIILDLSLVRKILNVNIQPSQIKKILLHLGFGVKGAAKNKMNVSVPLFREDISLPEDLIEEVARIYGYEKIPQTLPSVRPEINPCQARDLVCLTKNILIGLGLHEAVTYSLVDRGLLEGFLPADRRAVEIMNPLSQDQEVMRTALTPSLARCVSYNLNQKQEYVAIFEIANVFLPGPSLPKEELTLGIALSGARSLLLGEGLVKEETGFLHLKGVLERLLEQLGVKEVDFVTTDTNKINVLIGTERIGGLIQLRQEQMDKFEIKNKDVFVAEISLERLFAKADLSKKFFSPPRYPGISRDISFVFKEGVLAKDILSCLKEAGKPLLKSVEIVDYYKGKQIPAGSRSLTVTCLYRSPERTLTEIEVNPVHEQLISALTSRFGAKLR